MSKSDLDTGEVFDIDRIRRLVELMKEHDLSEVDLRQESQRIRLRRATSELVYTPAPQVSALAVAASAAPVAAAKTEEAEGEHITYIRSPMVGTFYASANPNSDAYVKIGDHVEPETKVCIVEAMKTFNEIEAEVRGRIIAVLVENEEPVDHGKRLFKVDTSV